MIPLGPPITQVGAYRIEKLLGRGGMGEVYLAEQAEPKRRVALKLIRADRASAEVLARFRREPRYLARLSHANVASVYEVGVSENGRPYVAMEYVDGRPFTEYCEAFGLPQRERLDLFLQVCDAVQHAHQKSVIHRDLKPSNVLAYALDGADRPARHGAKVIDFGIARPTERDNESETVISGFGQPFGTIEYMSPEQADGRDDIDVRTDVYALGTMLYELLTGTLPFNWDELRKAGQAAMIRALLNDEPKRPTAHVRSLRGDLEWIILRALEKDRERRYASVAEFSTDLRRHLRHEPVVAGPPTWQYRVTKFVRRNRAMVAAGVVAAAALVVATGVSIGFAWHAGVQRRAADRATRAAVTSERQARDELARGTQMTIELARQRGDWRTLLDRAAYALEEKLGDPVGNELDRVRALDGLYRFDEAAALATRLASSTNESHALRGSVLLWHGDLSLMRAETNAQGVALIREAIAAGLRDAERAYAEALLAESMPAAIASLEAALRADATNQQARQMLVISLVLAGRLDEAAAQVTSLRAIFPDDATFRLVAAVVATLRGRGDAELEADLAAVGAGLPPEQFEPLAELVRWQAGVIRDLRTKPVCEVMSANWLNRLAFEGFFRYQRTVQACAPGANGAAEGLNILAVVLRRFPPWFRSAYAETLHFVRDYFFEGADPADEPERVQRLERVLDATGEGLSMLVFAELQYAHAEPNPSKPEVVAVLRRAADAPMLFPMREYVLVRALSEVGSVGAFDRASLTDDMRSWARDAILELWASQRIHDWCLTGLALTAVHIDEYELADYLASERLREEPNDGNALKVRRVVANRIAALQAGPPLPSKP